MRRFLLSIGISVVAVGVAASPAVACGGLVAPNGAVRLAQTTTLAAYHDGVERYVTSFVYEGAQGSFGSIIPLPGVPSEVRRAGGWTLQRLQRETHPPLEFAAAGAATTAAAAQVLLHTTVDALDITVLSGGGQQVLDWVTTHGFALSPDAGAMLDFYARRSPVFLAARFDASAARARGQSAGDGTPVLITVPTPNPWVPLHILSLAKPATDPVQADVYLLTDRAPALLGVDEGVNVQVSEPASTSLLSDLRSDRDSSWVPDRAWLTYVRVDTTAGKLAHDLAIDASGANTPSPTQAGFDPLGDVPGALPAGLHLVSTVPDKGDGWVLGVVAIVTGVVAAASLLAMRLNRTRARSAQNAAGSHR